MYFTLAISAATRERCAALVSAATGTDPRVMPIPGPPPVVWQAPDERTALLCWPGAGAAGGPVARRDHLGRRGRAARAHRGDPCRPGLPGRGARGRGGQRPRLLGRRRRRPAGRARPGHGRRLPQPRLSGRRRDPVPRRPGPGGAAAADGHRRSARRDRGPSGEPDTGADGSVRPGRGRPGRRGPAAGRAGRAGRAVPDRRQGQPADRRRADRGQGAVPGPHARLRQPPRRHRGGHDRRRLGVEHVVTEPTPGRHRSRRPTRPTCWPGSARPCWSPTACCRRSRTSAGPTRR